MKKALLSFFLFAGLTVTAQQGKTSAEYRKAQQMLKQKDFFAAEDYIEKNSNRFSRFEKLVLEANTDNAFNRPAISNEKIDAVMKEFAPKTGDSLKLGLLRLKHGNLARLFEYDNAKAVTKEILASPSEFLDEAEKADFRNMGNIWNLLEGQPIQEVTINDATVIYIVRDKANLANLPVKSGDTVIDFIFDTGANLSTVTESTAARMGMKILGGSIEVGAITGTKVNAKIAVCPEFTLGNINVKNAVFLVFPDEALAFPQIGYQINGIIGFPVIEAMKEIQITLGDEFIVPKVQTKKSGQRMALDFLTPVIRIEGEHYTFDTGAVGTSLYTKYFEKHKAGITAAYAETDLELGGAGGMVTKKGYKVTFRPLINGKQLDIENVQLFKEQIGDEENYFYGNIGQDLIKQFQKMTINFDSMFVRFD